VSTTVESAAAVVSAVGRSMAEANQLSQARRGLAAELFHGAGQATDRAVEELYALMDLELPARVEPPARAHAVIGSPERALSR
jgi:hypothetical protein